VNRRRGFTLVELLVALTLLAVVGGSLLQLFHSGLRAARLAGAQSHAVLLARSKLNELQAYQALQPGVLSGSFDDDYRWEAVLTASPQPDSAEDRRLQPLDLVLTIGWGDAGDTRSFTLHSLLLSQWSES
jgi:prepilin-type N-terminal cleavage/methylation domain-containing protein